MENNFKNWVMDYGVIGRRRFFRKEKIRFIQRIETDFKAMGYACKILSPKGSKGKAIDLLIGDVKHAKNIIIASYDTPQKSFHLFSYKPFDLKHRSSWFFMITALPLILITLICFIFSTAYLKIEWMSGNFRWVDLWALIPYLIGILFIIRYSKGIPNGKNLDRNSSGVIALLQIASSLSDAQKETTAFVLTDFGCVNHLGDQMLKAYLKKYQKQKFIVVDCVGNKGTPAICYSDAFTTLIKKLDKEILQFPLDNEHNNIAQLYPNTLVISCGNVVNQTIVCPNVNTAKDIDLHPDKIQYIAQQIQKLL